MSLSAPNLPRLYLLVLGTLALLAPARAQAQQGDFERYDRARAAYDVGDYEQAVDLFEALVGGPIPDLAIPGLVAESRKFLGAAYLFVDRRPEALEQFRLILQADIALEMDDVTFPAAVREALEEVRLEVRREAEEAERAERMARERQLREMLAQQERLERLRELASRMVIEEENSRWIAAIPFGVGQFQNDNETFGWVLAIAEGALAVTSLSTYLLHSLMAEEQAPVDEPRFVQAERALRITNQVTTTLFFGLAITGILEAQLRFQPRSRRELRRELPPDLQNLEAPEPEGAPLEARRQRPRSAAPRPDWGLGLAPTGLSLRVRF